MQITEITVHAGRTFNHPYESYSNLRPEVTLKASLTDGEDPEVVVQRLQSKAEGLVEEHKSQMLNSLEAIHYQEQHDQEMASLEEQLSRSRARLAELQKEDRENKALRIASNKGIPVDDVEEELLNFDDIEEFEMTDDETEDLPTDLNLEDFSYESEDQ